jgi:hypothetical protein
MLLFIRFVKDGVLKTRDVLHNVKMLKIAET